MTLKQKRFCEEYIKSGNATQAATACGYSAKTARQQGQRLLTKKETAEYIKKLNEEITENNIADMRECLEALTQIIRKGNDKNKIAAADLRLKTLGAYIDKKELTGDITITVGIDEN